MATKDQKEANRKKGFNNFIEVTKKEWFRNKIIDLRQKYDLPLTDGNPAMSFAKPDDIAESPNYDPEIYAKEIQVICDRADLNPVDFAHIIMMYVMTGKTTELEEYFKGDVRCCFVEDIRERISFFDLTPEYEETAYPISLRIDPYASARDIKTYVEDFYKKKIEPLQKKYRDPKNMTGKIRSKDIDIQKRNDFIYDHKNLTLREIMDLTVNDYGLDQGEIAKIISYEKARRQ